MKGDVSRSAPGGSSMNPWSLSYPRWPLLWLTVVLGGLLLLAFVFAQAALANSHTANLDTLTLTDAAEAGAGVDLTPTFNATETAAYTATVLDAVKQVTVAAPPAMADHDVAITPGDADVDTAGHQVDLGIGETEITVTVDSGSTTRTYTVTITRIAANDASLMDLSLGDVELSPKFAAGTTAYTASVDNGVENVTVMATPVEGASAPLTTPASPVTLPVGDTLITVTVVAADGTTLQAYTVTVTRAASDDATLESLSLGVDVSLVPDFMPDTMEYTASVDNDLDDGTEGMQNQITVTATATAGELASVAISPDDAVEDDADEAATEGHQVDLDVGENIITVTVTAEDESTQIYTITVTRAAVAPSTDATLSDLSLGADVTLDPNNVPFDPQTMAYTATVANSVESVTVDPTKTNDADIAVITPEDADADTPAAEVELDVGETEISVRVTDGITTNTYTVAVTRVAANDASLTALSLGEGIDLSPEFDAGTTAYTASVPNDVDADTGEIQNMITVAATPVEGASVSLITPGGTNGPVTLPVGDTLITVTVEAANGTTLQAYTVTVTRAASSDATLESLSLGGDVSLVPDFMPDTMEYTADAANSVLMVTVTATEANAEAKAVISPDDDDADADDHQVDLDVGENIITVTVTVTAGDESTATYTVTVTRDAVGISSDSTLDTLTLTSDVDAELITLTPAVSAAETSYVASVDKFVTSATVVAMATDAGADVVITPADADDATDGYQVNLELGENTISAIVASSDGTTITTYTVTVTRAYGGATLSELSLSGVMLTPAFSADVTSYAGSVANDVVSTTVTAKAVLGATAEPADVLIDAGETVDLAAGDNTITVVVTSSDGTARTSYSVSVFRVHEATQLTELSLGEGVSLSPAFAEGTTSYAASVDNSTMQVTVTAMPSGDASMAIQDADGMAIEDADADADGHQVNLELGENTIAVAVSAADPAVTTTYTVVVTRGASSDAALSALSLDGVTLNPAFDAATTTYTANVANDVANTTVMATAAHADATVDAPAGQVDLAEGANTIVVTVTAADGSTTMTYTVVVARAVVVMVTVPGPTVTVPGPSRTRTVTETVIVEVPAPAASNVVGGTSAATATEVNGQVVITRHDGGPSLVVNTGGFIRDESLGQTYQVVRRADGMIVRQWVSPDSPLVYQIPWAVVNSQFSVPVGVVGAIPLDDQSGAPGQLVRRFDGGDDRIFSYAGMGNWRHVPDIPTFQALGLYWCDVTAADAGFFDRITIGSPHAATDMPARSDYPSCSTG